MINAAVLGGASRRVRGGASGRLFALAVLGVMAGAALLAGALPLGVAIAMVFLFAGPHNWVEARYFLARLPGRWGRLRGFFVLAFAGVVGLTLAFAAIPWLARLGDWEESGWLTAVALWNSALIAWVAALIHLRSRQNPRRDWSWTLPVALGLLGVNWTAPLAWDLGLVYLHPLMALWILDRELCRRRPEWRRAYHLCLACLPVLLAVLVWRLADAPDFPGTDALTERITRHVGADVLQMASPRLLVAAHAFLELLHYGVWLVAIPVLGQGTGLWQVGATPLGRRSPGWRLGLAVVLIMGAVLVVVLWAGFLADYPATRDVYFTVALAHVLAEVPFLLRAL
jgi:hypothetical protein